MREQPAVAPISPRAAALPPSSLQPPPVPSPAPVPAEDASTPRRLSPITAAAANAVPAKPAPSPTPPAGPPPSEQVLVASAIRSLRVQRSPAAALAALDQYQARYPKGSMLAETTRLRAEALLMLGERRAALDELNRAPGMGTAADEESRLVRGELAASAGRWQEALQDFDGLVIAWSRGSRGDTISPKLRARLERALWGRACARSHLGNEAGARVDLQELLRRFPQGKFAAQAAQRLGEPR
jgi:tetratricopeptide (TPR) repeat protein